MDRKAMRLLAALWTLACAATAFAESGDEVLAKVERTLTGPRDYEGTSTMILSRTDGTQKEQRSLRMWVAGKEKRVIKFLSPAGIEGIGLLTLSDSEMYLYLPAQNKIRRIEGGGKNEDFQGTDFSYNEMGSYDYQKDYSSEIQSEDETSWTLTLKRKPGADRPYDRLVMVVDKSSSVPKTIELYQGDRMKKLLTILEVEKTGDYVLPVRLRMENVEKKHVTEMTIGGLRLDQGLEANDVFSKRFLKKKG
jgi:outer membrane lipoprotein-sorting protein